MYEGQDKEIMLITAKSKNQSRLRETIDFAKHSGYKKLGIANCISVKKYAEKLADILKNEGFEVVMIHCRESGFDGSAICDTMSGSCCDPLAQAQYLNAEKTDMNIVLGLCVGHGIIFQKHSEAPCTVFLVKDLSTKHKTIESLV